MKKLLIYPHGLGDCLMLTPTLREYNKETGDKFSVCIQKRFESSEIFKNNPYIDKVFYIKDPWNDYPNYTIGTKGVINDGVKIGRENGFDNTIYVACKSNLHKIIQNAIDTNVTLKSTDIDIFISDEDRVIADSIISNKIGNDEFGFIQTKTGAGVGKDLPYGFGEKFLKDKGLNHFIEIGKTFKYDEYNLNVQFELLRRAKGVCIPDSVFYHGCIGLDKNIDFVYFGRGKSVYDRVGSLNDKIIENVKYKI